MPPKERELKLQVAPADLRRLKQTPLLRAVAEKPQRSRQVSVYFDTAKFKLRREGLMLRVRRVGERHIQTVKATSNGKLFERDEWECDIAGDGPDLDLAADTALGPLLGGKLRARLKPVFETSVSRTVYPISRHGQEVALSIDRGRITTTDRSAALCEIELELERGDQNRLLFDIARELNRTIPVQIAFKSKAERGYELVEGEPDAPAGSTTLYVHRGMSTRTAFQIMARSCLKQIVGNQPAVLGGKPDGVHQMRIGIRRLRAAMSAHGELLGDEQSNAIKGELKWLAGALTPARELDVLLVQVVAPLKRGKRRTDPNGLSTLPRALEKERKQAYRSACEAVQSARYRELALSTAEWIEAGRWLDQQDDLLRDRAGMPVETFAAEALQRRWRKFRKKAKGLAKLDAEDRHKCRIQGKKLRYAAEFFAEAFPAKRAQKRLAKFMTALKKVQDCLGVLNDIAVHENRIAAMGMQRSEGSRKKAFEAGLVAGHEDARYDAAMRAAVAAYDELAVAKPFWR
jgi:triphosphatase